MHTEMAVSEARETLPEIIENIETTGPITVTRYGKPVATISAYLTTEARDELKRVELKRFLALLDRVGTESVWDDFERMGIDTADRIEEFLAQAASLGRDIDFRWDLRDVPGGLSIPQMVAAVHLGKDTRTALTDAGQDIVAWSEVLREVQRAAEAKGDNSHLTSYSVDWAECGPIIVDEALDAGMTPDTFKDKALSLIGEGVKLVNLSDSLGDGAIPSDVVALDGYDAYYFQALLKDGFPLAEACKLVRSGKFANFKDACEWGRRFAAAGVQTAPQVIQFHEEGLNYPLAQRAHRCGVSVERWALEVKAVQKYRYAGTGALPFQLLNRAAFHGVSLTAWDDNKVAAKQAKERNKFGGRDGLDAAPWAELYEEPELILELGRAKVSPAFVAELNALAGLNTANKWFDMDARAHVDTYKKVHKAGLTAPVLKQMYRVPRGQQFFRPTLEQLLDFGNLGITEAEAKYLRESSDRPSAWFFQINSWQRNKPQIDAWVREQQEKPGQWSSIEHLAKLVADLRKDSTWSRSVWVRDRLTPLVIEALALDVADLHHGHVAELMTLSEWAIRQSKTWGMMAEYFHNVDIDAVRRMLYEFQTLMSELFPRPTVTVETPVVTVERVPTYDIETKEIGQ